MYYKQFFKGNEPSGEVIFAKPFTSSLYWHVIDLAKRDKGTAALGSNWLPIMTATIKALVGLYMGKDTSIDTGYRSVVVGQSLFGYITATTISITTVLGFFRGSRFVPIVTSFASIFIWLSSS